MLDMFAVSDLSCNLSLYLLLDTLNDWLIDYCVRCKTVLSEEGLNRVKRVAWNVQKVNRVSWKREKINPVSWIIFVQITLLFVAVPKLWTIIWCIWSNWYF